MRIVRISINLHIEGLTGQAQRQIEGTFLKIVAMRTILTYI